MPSVPAVPADRIRLTISVSPEVHAAFTRLAAVSNSSIGREMGDFLGETVDAVQFIAGKMEEARAAPGIVAREMHAYALGLADETGALMAQMRKAGAAVRTASAGRPGASVPPSSNTGGKPPRKPSKNPGRAAS